MIKNGTLKQIESDDILATCIQHELDHLDGKLYIDYLSSLKRQMFINKRSVQVFPPCVLPGLDPGI